MKEDYKQIERAVQLRNGYCATAIGILVTVVGGGITLVTWYFAGPGGGYIITWGALAVGGYYTIRGASLIASNASSKKITSTVALASTVILVVFLGGSLLALLDSFGVFMAEPPDDSKVVWMPNEEEILADGQVKFSGTVTNVDSEWSIERARITITLFDEIGRSISSFEMGTIPRIISPGTSSEYSKSRTVHPGAHSYESEISWLWSPP